MKPSILVVDDDEKIRHLLTDYFESEDFRVDAVANIKSAIEQLRKARLPDILILDVMLPDGNGVDLLKKLRSIPKTQALPVILITAHFLEGTHKAKAFELGADDYMGKPFDLIELKSRIIRLVKPRKTINVPPQEKAEEALDSAARASEVLSGIYEKPKQPASSPVKAVLEPERDNTLDSQKETPKDLLVKYFKFLLDPKKLIQNWKKELSGKFIYLGMVLFSLGFGIQNGIEKNSMGVGMTSVIGVFLLSYALVSLLSWVLQWLLGLKQKRILFKELLTGISVLWFPLSLSSFLGAIYVYFGGGKTNDFTVSPLLFLPNQAESFVGFLLRRMDVFELWGVWLVSLMLASILELKLKKARRWVFGVWAFLVLSIGLASEFLK